MAPFKKVARAALDGAFLLALAVLWIAAVPAPAFAYVDPSVMTYTIQALAGVAVALSAVLGVAFRRTRRALLAVLHIDGDAGKSAEGPVRPIEPNDPQAAHALAAADEAARRDKAAYGSRRPPRALSWPRRFALAFIACLFAAGTVLIVAPLEVVGSAPAGLLFGFYDVVGPVVVLGIAVAVVAALILSALRGRAFNAAVALAAALGLCCYIQALAMNSALPVADGRGLELSAYLPITIVSFAVWVLILSAVATLAVLRPDAGRTAAVALSAVLIVVQAVGVGSVALAPAALAGVGHERIVATHEGLYDLSAEENTVVFVLDTYDARYLNRVLEQKPDALDEFTGFTYFRNAAPSMVPTRYAVPFLLTGRMPDGTQSFPEFVSTWFKKSSFLKDIADQGYTLGVYTDSLGTDVVNADPYVMNIHEATAPAFDRISMLGALERMAFYRDMPWVLKPAFWFTTDDLNRAFVSAGDDAMRPYTVDDSRFAQGLRSGGLALNDEAKSFRFIHMLGPHKPYTLDEQGYASENPTDLDAQAKGTLAIVGEYLRQMKAMGIYDDASIIITADHGNWQLDPQGIDEETSVVMLVKPAQTAEEASAPLAVSDVPTGHLDYAATVIAAVGGDSSAYGPTVFQVPEGPRPRYYWSTTTDYHEDMDWTQYRIEGDVLDFDDWEKTGTVIEIPNKDRP